MVRPICRISLSYKLAALLSSTPIIKRCMLRDIRYRVDTPHGCIADLERCFVRESLINSVKHRLVHNRLIAVNDRYDIGAEVQDSLLFGKLGADFFRIFCPSVINHGHLGDAWERINRYSAFETIKPLKGLYGSVYLFEETASLETCKRGCKSIGNAYKSAKATARQT